MNALMIVTLAILAVSLVEGLKKGFIRTALELLVKLILIGISFTLAPFVVSFFFKSFLIYGVEALNYLLVFILLYAILNIAVFLFVKALNILAKLPIIKEVNGFAGLLAGLLKGMMRVWILFAVITIFAATDFGMQAYEMIQANRILSFLYENNLILFVVYEMT